MLGSLMGSRRFAPLFWCQFFSAFNDNFLKTSLVFLILFKVASESAPSLVSLGAATLIAPAFFLSGLGGQIADRYDKALIAQRLKLNEIAAAAIAVTGFLLNSVPILFLALFLFGIIAALFGPIKYGILPDHLEREELPAGNALVEGATFLAILIGTIAAGISVANGGQGIILAAVVMGVAILSWGFSLYIPKTGSAAPELVVNGNIIRSTFGLIGGLRKDPRIWRCAWMIGWFWTVGAVVISVQPTFVKDTLGGTEEVVTVYLALFSIGIALGSLLASWLAKGRIVLLPTPIAAFVMGLLMLDLALATINIEIAPASFGLASFFTTGPAIHAGIDFFALSVAAGLYIVPAMAAVQAWSPPAERARVIAGINVISAAFLVGGSLFTALLQRVGLTPPLAFLVLGLGNFLAGLLIFRVLPTSPFRDFLSILFRAFLRLEVKGGENFKLAGPNAIIALNHVSFLDAALGYSLLDRDPVFAIDSGIARLWWVRPFLKLTRAMPLDPTSPMATRKLINAVTSGETLIIFPEGRLTATGSLMKVYDGAGLVADKSDAMIVPVRIDGIEHTPFTRMSRDQAPRKWWPKVTVTVLPPVKLSIAPELRGKHRRQAAGAALYQVMSDLVFRTTSIDRTVFAAVVGSARRNGFGKPAVEDPVSGILSYRRLLVGAAVLGRKLMDLAPHGGAIGVLLPNSNAAATTITGLMSAGRVPAMINFTAGASNILSACTAAEVTTIITSRSFIEKAKLVALIEAISAQVKVVYLEDIRTKVSIFDRLRGLHRAKRPLATRAPNDPAVILFTSGSEGTPKGVVLSHRNLLANAAQAAARIDFGRTDKAFNVLPVFHSFGLTVGLILPLVSGVHTYLYPSPLHYRVIPELVYGTNATILFGTDTFLAGYARTANAYDFRSLRYILAGAEPVKETTRRVYAEKFGLRILEGYGATETAPALALNTPMFNKAGTVGRILPGMEVRLDPVPGIKDGGRLFVRGPNVMLGYLRVDRPGVIEPPEEGWHDTGDIVAIDEEGFITIKGRAKRFAKIGGEMVSLAAVDSLCAELWPDGLSATVAMPDPKKGEKIVLVTEQSGANRNELQRHARASGASELMVPSEIMIVPTVPVLGSGKVDIVAVSRLVDERYASVGAIS